MPPGECCAVVGVQPPPLHGFSAMNARMARLLERQTKAVIVDLAVHVACRKPDFPLRRIGRAVTGLMAASAGWREARRRTLYLGLCGGWGQALDLAFLGMARSFGARIVVHHHSFAYLDRRRPLTWLVMETAGSGATHVVLCDAMKKRLQVLYGAGLKTLTVCNAALLERGGGAVPRESLRSVAFLGNICREKGIETFLDVAGRMRDSGLAFRVAGPFAGPAAEQRILTSVAGLPNVSFAGPLFGEAKLRFLAESDALLFPTRYRNEADPLVLYEALAQGMAVVAPRRGCIGSTIDASCGRVVEPGENFADVAVAQLRAWMADAVCFGQIAAGARRQYEMLRSRDEREAARLLRLLSDGPDQPGSDAGERKMA